MSTLAKWIRRAVSLFTQTEKTVLKTDAFSLEHVLYYHGLVGTSPEGSRAFKDVRADLASAVSRTNSHMLSICLKLPPLTWQDKLEKIADEIAAAGPESRANLVKTLLPGASDVYEESTWDPLSYDDWQVQANAALLLAHLQVEESLTRMTAALARTAGSTSPAFLHISRALASLRGEQAKTALTAHLQESEAWLKVDATAALAHWPLEEIQNTLQTAFEEQHKFSDYQAVAVYKRHEPSRLIEQNTTAAVNLGCEIVVGVLDALASTFANQYDFVDENELLHCLTLLSKRTGNHAFSPVELRAVAKLLRYADDLPSSQKPTSNLADAGSRLDAQAIEGKMIKYLQERKEGSQLRHAVKLCGELKLKGINNDLMALLTVPGLAADVTAALGKLGQTEAAPRLIALAKSLVNIENRTALPPSQHPVAEEDEEAALTYWQILKALGSMPTDEACEFLLKATEDVSPDKREAALASLVDIYLKSEGKIKSADDIAQSLTRALQDPSLTVRQYAITGASSLDRPEPIEALSRLTLASETSLSRSAFDALEYLARAGQKDAVKAALTALIASERSTARVKKINDFMLERLK